MEETVVVTVRSGAYEEDYELPVNVPLGELYPRLLMILKRRNSLFETYPSILLVYNHGGMLNKNATLADYGVLRGGYLDVVREEMYHGIG